MLCPEDFVGGSQRQGLAEIDVEEGFDGGTRSTAGESALPVASACLYASQAEPHGAIRARFLEWKQQAARMHTANILTSRHENCLDPKTKPQSKRGREQRHH